MTWCPVPREELDARIADELSRLDESSCERWERMRVEPVKWRCSPWGDDGGGFWVVAEHDGLAVWFNDIEDGFNTSRIEMRGVIAEYRCDQTTLAEVLERFAETREAEARARSAPSVELPASCLGPGRIERRQTTYWELRSSTGLRMRAHFSGKRESRFEVEEYETIELSTSHPLLVHHSEPWESVYVTGAALALPATLQELSDRVRAASSGWRRVEEYMGDTARMSRLIVAGDGLLLNGPRSVAAIASEVLERRRVVHSTMPARASSAAPRVLVLGRSYVIADAFRFDPQFG